MFCYFGIYRFLQRMSDSFLMMCYLSYCLRRVLLKNSIVHQTFERKQLSKYYESQLKSMFLFYRLLCLLFVLLLRKYSPLIFVLLRLYFIFSCSTLIFNCIFLCLSLITILNIKNRRLKIKKDYFH